MKRDRDRIRNLLIQLEDAPNGIIIVGGTIGSSNEEVLDDYHLNLMADEQLVVETGEACWRLTALGHDAVEAIEQNEIWETLKKVGPKEAYEIVKNLGSTIAMTALSKLMGWG